MLKNLRPFLRRLNADTAGNTLAILAAALLPLLAMIGSGLDVSRAYMAKNRLQSACDAASLAARRSMKNDQLDSEVQQTGERFFNFNFPQGFYGTTEFQPQITKPEPGLIRIAAETRIPTTLMKVFGFDTLPLSVSCEASLNFVNTDVVLVLDVTGSMKDPVGGTPKMQALQDAVMALYDELAPVQSQLQAQGLRLRYGIVPYSSTVNVGRLLYAANPDYIRNDTPYQTRVANFTRRNPWNGPYEFENWTYREETLDTREFKRPNGVIRVATRATGTFNQSRRYNPQQMALANPHSTDRRVSWNGCIEERDTVSSITGTSGFTIPSDAFDLDINGIPNGERTRWRPMLPEAVYTRTAGTTSATVNQGSTVNTGWMMRYAADQGYSACPAEARRLREWNRPQLASYVQSLEPIGGTYHDIGMIWGGRFISTGGVFGDGCEEYNGMPCNRHVIFMTDGDQTAYCDVYTAYGVEQNDMRTTGSGNCRNQLARHEQRFRMMCNAVKNMNVSLWVIAFDTGLNANLTGCATNPSQASTSSDRDALIARFREIGNQIGALRLTK